MTLSAFMLLGPGVQWHEDHRHIAMERTQSHGNSQDVMSTVSPATRSQPREMCE